MRKKLIVPVQKWDPPRGRDDLVRQIAQTFADNGWDSEEQQRYALICGCRPTGPNPLAECPEDELRRIHDRMVAARMILLKAR